MASTGGSNSNNTRRRGRKKKSKSASWKSGIGLEMVQHLLNLCEDNIKNLPGKGAGPVARRQAVQSTMEAFAGRADVNVYSFSKLEKVLSAMCKHVSTGNHCTHLFYFCHCWYCVWCISNAYTNY